VFAFVLGLAFLPLPWTFRSLVLATTAILLNRNLTGGPAARPHLSALRALD
jgi:hypothetical protein